jgi:hypothetical protein
VAGGLYLVWLGIGAIRSRGGAKVDGAAALPDESLLRLFGKGLFANSINPKVVLFFLSFLPQFIVAGGAMPAGRRRSWGWFTAQACVLFGLLGYFSGAVGTWLEPPPPRRPVAGPRGRHHLHRLGPAPDPGALGSALAVMRKASSIWSCTAMRRPGWRRARCRNRSA